MKLDIVSIRNSGEHTDKKTQVIIVIKKIFLLSNGMIWGLNEHFKFIKNLKKYFLKKFFNQKYFKN